MRAIRGIIVAAAIASSPAVASQPETVRICFEEWAPYASIEEGKPTGLVIDLVDRALAASGRSASYVTQPYQRCIAEVRSGNADAILMSSDEDGLVPAPVSVAFWEVGVVARSDWPADSYGSLADFNGAAMGLVDDYEYHPAVTAARAGWTVTVADDDLLSLRMAAAGRIDATLTDLPWAREVAARESLQLKLLSPVLVSVPQHVFFRPDLAAVAGEVGSALGQLVEDGTVDRLYRARLGSSFQEARDRSGTALLKD